MTEKRYGMVIDTQHCVGCQTCTVSCKISNEVPGSAHWNHLESLDGDVLYQSTGTFPRTTLAFRPLLCNHCENPACVANCPTGAMHKREEDGIVESDHSVCIGCGTCAQSCPYGAPVVADDLGYAMKCDFCRPRVERDEEPLCVCSCPAEARVFGEISDPNSEISKLIAELSAEPLLREEGTEPSVRYC